MEYIDVLDENGLPTGRTASRQEVHQKGLWHRAILVAIVDKNNRVLIQQRSANKEKYPNKWDISVAGHVSSGYDSLNAVYAEVMEEIGTQIPSDIDLSDFRYVTSFRDQRKVSDHFIENQFYDLFLLKLSIPSTDLELQLEEVQAIDYKNPFQLKQMKDSGLFHPRDEWIDIIYKLTTKIF